jgi:hypothetical protein
MRTNSYDPHRAAAKPSPNMLQILQHTSQPHTLSHSGILARRTEKRHADRNSPQTGAEHDFSQSKTLSSMQTSVCREKMERTSVLTEPRNNGASVQAFQLSCTEILPRQRSMPHRLEKKTRHNARVH